MALAQRARACHREIRHVSALCPEEISFLPAQTESEWVGYQFDSRARSVALSLSLPDWKVLSISIALELIFTRLIRDGKSFDDALIVIDSIVATFCDINV